VIDTSGKARVHGTLEGRPVDRCPVTALYSHYYQADHFVELTGLPAWKLHWWRQAAPDDHVDVLARMLDVAPFDTVQLFDAPSREDRAQTRVFEKDGRAFREGAGRTEPIADSASGHAADYAANEHQHVFDRRDADEHIRVVPAAVQGASGVDDYVEAAVGRLGRDHFIIAGSVAGTLFSCGSYLGQTNTFAMLVDNPALVDYVCSKVTEQNVETIRRLAATGGDAIIIDDATATADMISVAHYERFSLPYMRTLVDEIHRAGLKAIVIYFGAVMDRLDQIASLGADGLSVECSMKGYVNDIDAIARRIGDRVSLFANIDPVGVLEKGSDTELEREVARQVQAGRRARGFLVSPASPITPATPLTRVCRFIEVARATGGPEPVATGTA
jgi:uroporphyrinogen-III decarboxylase